MKLFMMSIILILSIPLYSKEVKKNPTEKNSRFEKLELFNKVLYLIEGQYYREVDMEKLIQGALRGMMATLDPHSAFLDKEVFKNMQEGTDGEYGGIGIEVTYRDGSLVVVTPIDDTPAAKAGVLAGDAIVEINHENTIGLTLDEAIEKLKGKLGQKIHLGVKRNGQDKIIHISMVRRVIKTQPVKSELIENEYIFLRLGQFQRDSAKFMGEHIQNYIKEIGNENKIKGIVLDLRSNPGGLLDEAVNVASLFLKDGIVVSTEGRDGKNKEIKYVKKSGLKILKAPMVVLINASSASASEIVAGALQDHKRAIIMGRQSFGKGSVQSVAKIDNENGVKLTIAQYMTPNDRKIQAIGITPDVELDEVDAAWLKNHKQNEDFVREIDLRNHLTSTIETNEESKLINDKKKKDRLKRIERIQNKEKKKDAEFAPYIATEDFQVLQAVNFLKTFGVYNNFIKKSL